MNPIFKSPAFYISVFLVVTALVALIYFLMNKNKQSGTNNNDITKSFIEQLQDIQNNVVANTKKLNEYAKLYVDGLNGLNFSSQTKTLTDNRNTSNTYNATINTYLSQTTNAVSQVNSETQSAITADRAAEAALKAFNDNVNKISTDGQKLATDALSLSKAAEDAIVKAKATANSSLATISSNLNTSNGYKTQVDGFVANGNILFSQVQKLLADAISLRDALIGNVRGTVEYNNLQKASEQANTIISFINSVNPATRTTDLNKVLSDAQAAKTKVDNTLKSIDAIFQQAYNNGVQITATAATNISIMNDLINEIKTILGNMATSISSMVAAQNTINGNVATIDGLSSRTAAIIDIIIKVGQDILTTINTTQAVANKEMDLSMAELSKIGVTSSAPFI
jgi:hypothetical protein